jgi:hypothetical protein
MTGELKVGSATRGGFSGVGYGGASGIGMEEMEELWTWELRFKLPAEFRTAPPGRMVGWGEDSRRGPVPTGSDEVRGGAPSAPSPPLLDPPTLSLREGGGMLAVLRELSPSLDCFWRSFCCFLLSPCRRLIMISRIRGRYTSKLCGLAS